MKSIVKTTANKIVTYIQSLTLTTNQLVFWVCCYIALVMNIPFLYKTITIITSVNNYDVLFLFSIPLFLLSLTLVLQSILAIKWLTKPLLILMVISSSLIFYATISYGTVFDYGMVQNTMETDSAEALSYLNFYAIGFFIIFGLLPSFLIYSIKINYQPFFKELYSRVKLISSSLIVIAIIASVFYSNYAAVGRNNKELVSYITPYKMLDASYKYVRNHFFYPPLEFKVLDTTPSIIRYTSKQHVTVLVLGETARSQSFSLNGYNRATNQYTAQQDVVSFANIHSCGTATAVSVPCMFSRLNKNNYDKRVATSQQNVLDIIRLAGADVLWISNNNGSCKGVCTRVKSMKVPTDKSNPLCDGEYCFDEALINPLNEKLNHLTNENTLIVLHMIGSHGPTYFHRYPKNKRIFMPDCQRSDIQHCTHEQLLNSYDNTIAYTDYVLSEVIATLNQLSLDKNIETSMLYISDHGESLGEKGVYLHGLPYTFAPEEQTHIPMIYWNDGEQTDFSLNCLDTIAAKPMTHDNLFDTLLSIMSVKSIAYNAQSDSFIQCKSQGAIARTLINQELPNEELIERQN